MFKNLITGQGGGVKHAARYAGEIIEAWSGGMEAEKSHNTCHEVHFMLAQARACVV